MIHKINFVRSEVLSFVRAKRNVSFWIIINLYVICHICTYHSKLLFCIQSIANSSNHFYFIDPFLLTWIFLTVQESRSDFKIIPWIDKTAYIELHPLIMSDSLITFYFSVCFCSLFFFPSSSYFIFDPFDLYLLPELFLSSYETTIHSFFTSAFFF